MRLCAKCESQMCSGLLLSSTEGVWDIADAINSVELEPFEEAWLEGVKSYSFSDAERDTIQAE